MNRRADRVAPVSDEVPLVIFTLQELKDHLRLTHDSEDEKLRNDLRAAVLWAEAFTRRSLESRSWVISNESWPQTVWTLPLGVVTAIESISYKDVAGNTQTWSSSLYEADLSSRYQCRLRPLTGETWPTLGNYFNSVAVTVTAGWTDTAPEPVKQAVYLKAGDYFDIRSGTDQAPGNSDIAELYLVPYQLPEFA